MRHPTNRHEVMQRTALSILLVAIVASCGWYLLRDRGEGDEIAGGDLSPPQQPLPERPTFAEHIAPLIYSECVICHRPGQVAPFELLTYKDAKNRGRQLVEVTQSRYMPPFLPDATKTTFRNERHLSDRELKLLSRWVDQDCPEGDPAKVPPVPQFASDWHLGVPDLTVAMDEEYTLPPEGDNVFRHFVVRIPTKVRRYCKGFEFRTSNPRVVHHARFMFDETANSRILDEADPEPGYSMGMGTGSGRDPEGHWLGWTPGKQPTLREEKYAWPLPPGCDLVIELHMLPTGKPEPITCELAFYYSDTRPTDLPNIVRMGPTTIDIAPNEADYEHVDRFEVPVDVDLLNVYPHAHLIAEKMEAYATLPTGKRQCLIEIPQWDFNWQDEYQYADPIRLPAGTVIEMKYTFNNSDTNIRNPFSPPQRVLQGKETTDEMGDLWFQMVPIDRANRRVVQDAVNKHQALWVYREAKFLCETRPSVESYNMYGMILDAMGKRDFAREQYVAAVRMQPECIPALNNLATSYMKTREFDEAERLLRKALRLRETYPSALINLGKILVEQKRYPDALPVLRKASQSSSHKPVVWVGLAKTYLGLKQLKPARDCAEYALKLDPLCKPAVDLLSEIRRAK